MTANEFELLRIIRENDNPEQALMAAALIIVGFLKQHGSSEEQALVCLQEHDLEFDTFVFLRRHC